MVWQHAISIVNYYYCCVLNLVDNAQIITFACVRPSSLDRIDTRLLSTEDESDLQTAQQCEGARFMRSCATHACVRPRAAF
jgi:hypothetical protein